MTETRILWLALGVFVGFMLWGEQKSAWSRKTQPTPELPIAGNNTVDQQLGNNFPPQCGTC